MSSAQIKKIRARLTMLREEVQYLEAKLDAYRVKCPGCRCRIIPGETCECCAQPVMPIIGPPAKKGRPIVKRFSTDLRQLRLPGCGE